MTCSKLDIFYNNCYISEKKIGIIGGPQVGKSSVVSTILKQCGRTKAKRSTMTKLSDNLKLVTMPGNRF